MTRNEIQREYAGNWVAVRDGVVVEAWGNPYGLVQRLRERMIDDATISAVRRLESRSSSASAEAWTTSRRSFGRSHTFESCGVTALLGSYCDL